ncbi:MAG: helix-turn-helix domain-containing protein [Halapricum sp.]
MTAAFRLDGGAIHPWGAVLTADPDVERGPVYEMELVDDGPAKILCRLSGDIQRGYELTRDHDLVVEVDATDRDRGLLYARVEMPPVPRRMMTFPRKTMLVLTMPLRFQPDGACVATFVGDDADFPNSLWAVPDAVDVELIETGEYNPETTGPLATLTARQQTILQAAMRLGYYEEPRQATQADIATDVGISPGTVGEHLRKIESRVFARLLE